MERVDHIDGLQIVAELSRSDTSVVYKAYEKDLQRFVLLKILYAGATDGFADRMREEARLLARLSHPNVPAVYAFEADAGQARIATEFVDGKSVAELLEETGKLPEAIVLLIGHAVAKGLAGAHAAGILHRDVEPSNVLVAYSGVVKLADFGLASVIGEGNSGIRGTLGYLAPEVLLGREAGKPSDQFSLGASLYAMLIGDPPFRGSTLSEKIDSTIKIDPIPRLRLVAPASEAVIRLCGRLLDKKPENRFSSFDEIVKAVEVLLAAYDRTVGAADIELYLSDRSEWVAPGYRPGDSSDADSNSAFDTKTGPARAGDGPGGSTVQRSDTSVVARVSDEAESVLVEESPQGSAARASIETSRVVVAAIVVLPAIILAIMIWQGVNLTGGRDLHKGEAGASAADSSLLSIDQPPNSSNLFADNSPDRERESLDGILTDPQRTSSADNETMIAGEPRNSDPVAVLDDRTDESAEREAPIPNRDGDLGDNPLRASDSDSLQNDDAIPASNILDTLSADMSQGLAARRGSIRLSVLPWAMVSIDDSSVGTTPLAGPIALAAGDYLLRLENPGFPAVTRSVRVVAGEEQNLDIVLWKSVNRVFMKVVPWAEVSVDGVVRDTVQTLSSPLILSPGPHSIVFRHPSFKERTIRHISIAGSIDTLSVNLTLPAN